VDQLRVRIGIETGAAAEQDGDYFGEAVNRTARLMSAGWGDQVVLGPNAAKSEKLPPDAELTDQGVHMLRDLLEPLQIFTLSHPDIHSVFPPLRTVSAHPHNLPVQPTEFVGRKRELQEIALLLQSQNRVITLLGYGGAGKTRTSLQAAAEASSQFKHGVWFVPLENADSANAIIASISEALLLRFSRKKPPEIQLSAFLEDREILLILDNFEHLTAHSAVVSRLAAASPGLRVLITSRQRLGIREETVFDLSGMTLPDQCENSDESCDSVELFFSSASRVFQNFSPDRDETEAVARICRILQGLPLAIELAAPWVRTISCTELEKELTSSFEILESTAGDRPERQNSIEAVFLYSWNLLSCTEQAALSGLSIFEEPFSREAASEVAGCSLRTLKSLSEKSLLKNRDGKYFLHPLTKELAAEHQILVPDLEEKHSRYFHNLSVELNSAFAAGNQPEILDQMACLFPDVRKAALFAFQTLNHDLMLSFIRLLSSLFQLRSQFLKGIELYRSLLDCLENAKRSDSITENEFADVSARLKERLASFHTLGGQRNTAEQYLLEAAALSESMSDPGFRYLCLAGLGNMAYLKGNLADAETHWSQALNTARELDNTASVAALLGNLSGVKMKLGNLPAARELLHEAETLNSATGNKLLQASIFAKLGDIALLEENQGEAEGFYKSALALNNQLVNSRGSSYCLERLAILRSHVDVKEGIALAEKALEHAVRFDAVVGKVSARMVLAELLIKDGRNDLALEQLHAVQREPGLENFSDLPERIKHLLDKIDYSY